jgi:PGF-pre-PGF domain-containing protein
MASRERLYSIPLTALVLFFLILGSSGASAGTETQLTHNALLTDSTAIYGNIVTWSETAGNGVHVYDIAAGKEINVGSTGGGNVRVCGNNIIWADMDGNIRMYDVSTDNWTTISSDGDLPDIYGNYVVYTKYYYIQDNKNDDIYLYDLNTHNETKIASVHGYPAIYDKKVVWSQANSNNGYDIYKYDISTNQTSIITTADSYVSKLDIYGNVVVWTESYKVYMYDMASHKTTQVTNTGQAYDPAIDGDRIVYTLSESHSSDIYMYEISTARTTRITTSTRAFSPSIYEDKIIYADLRNPENPDVRDIFLYDLSSTVQNPLVAEFTANITSGTAPLVVLFTDTSTGGVPTSWHWDTGDGIYSKHAMNATHTFTKPGSYTVSLTVGNAVGNSTATKPNYIVVTDPNAPVANFNSSVTEGYAPLTVQFNDISQNAMSRVWDFDSDGKADSTDVSPVYTYTTPGTYTVNLTAGNANGTSLKTAQITVLETSSSSSESSGGSSHSSSGSSDGGGAGGSPEPAKNVQVKELSQAFVTNEKSVKFDFPKNATCVVYVSFDSKKTFGKTTTIAEQLKGKSTLVSKLPYGEVYKSFNIWVGNGGVATSKNIENPVVCFKVEKSWINDKKINEDSITLNRYSDKKWEQLPVTLSGEDNKFMYFTAETSGFSSFVITGTSKTSSEEIVSVIEVDYPETINNNTENKEPQKEQKEILKTPGFEIYYGVASLLVVLLYKRR